MEIIKMARQGGKTMRMLKLLSERPDAYLFVHSGAEKQRILRLIKTVPELCTRFNGVFTPKIRKEQIKVICVDTIEGLDCVAMIDNVDLILERIIRGRVTTVSCS